MYSLKKSSGSVVEGTTTIARGRCARTDSRARRWRSPKALAGRVQGIMWSRCQLSPIETSAALRDRMPGRIHGSSAVPIKAGSCDGAFTGATCAGSPRSSCLCVAPRMLSQTKSGWRPEDGWHKARCFEVTPLHCECPAATFSYMSAIPAAAAAGRSLEKRFATMSSSQTSAACWTR